MEDAGIARLCHTTHTTKRTVNIIYVHAQTYIVPFHSTAQCIQEDRGRRSSHIGRCGSMRNHHDTLLHLHACMYRTGTSIMFGDNGASD